ncbi:MAG TPA: hypothetical protein VJB70_05105 [Candidatus Paceibacterota bacterium]
MLTPEARRGQKNIESSQNDFDIALKKWQIALPGKRQRFALGVLANAQSMGKKLIELVDIQTADAIRSDAAI